MRNLSIFNTWHTTPNFSTRKAFVSPFNPSMLRVKTFMLAPKKLEDNKSTINYLKNNLGIVENEVLTFKTEFISVNPTIYNGHYLSLKVNNDMVELFINNGVLSGSIQGWNIDNLVNTLSIKNPHIDFKISKSNIENLIRTGKMAVKFNVSKIKDHGTIWKIV
jgi:hypothetical protein